MNLLEARDGSYEPGSEYYFKVDPRLVDGIFYKFDPPRRWSRPITLRHVSETEAISASRDLPKPTRKQGKSRYSSPIPGNLFPDAPLQDENGREFAMVGRKQLAEERLLAVRKKRRTCCTGRLLFWKDLISG